MKLTPDDVRAHAGAVRAEIARSVVAMESEIELILCAALAGRHVLLEGVPGLGKTHMARTLAVALGCSYRRIQFTPDLLPSDIVGTHVYDPRDSSFRLELGPIHAHIVLADEINRAPAKTQSALLEVMQERQVTIEGETVALDAPFMVLATQNPIEHEGVYPLPQAQLDRFGMRLIVSHPPPEVEKRIYALHRAPLPDPRAVLDPETIRACQTAVGSVTVSDEILDLLVRLATCTRAHDGVLLGSSPRVGLDIVALARARAMLLGRDHVLPDDVKYLFRHVANHRIAIEPRASIGGLTSGEVIDAALARTQLA